MFPRPTPQSLNEKQFHSYSDQRQIRLPFALSLDKIIWQKNPHFISLPPASTVIAISRKNASEIFIIIGDILHIKAASECVCFGEHTWNHNNMHEYRYDVVVRNVVQKFRSNLKFQPLNISIVFSFSLFLVDTMCHLHCTYRVVFFLLYISVKS